MTTLFKLTSYVSHKSFLLIEWDQGFYEVAFVFLIGSIIP